jgi:simple sugar transport system substrate-binding protein
MKRRMLALLGALLLAISVLTGCSAGETEAVEETETPLITVGFSQTGSESDWRVALTESMKTALSEENGYQLIFEDSQQKQENQFASIRRFIQQKVDYIVVAPITETGWEGVLQEAKAAGIPVIIADRMVDVEDESLYAAHVGSDFEAEGEKAVAWLERELSDTVGRDEPVNIVHVIGTLNSSAQLGRTEALRRGLERHPNWNLVAQVEGDFIQAKTKEELRKVLQETQDIDVVYCENDNEAFGVMELLDEAGISYGEGGDVIIISFDAGHNALTRCLAGDINLDVECNPLLGPLVEDIISRLEAGETVESSETVEEAVFDARTITQEMIDERAY